MPPPSNFAPPPVHDAGYFFTRCDIENAIGPSAVEIDFAAIGEPPDRIAAGAQFSNRPPVPFHALILLPRPPAANSFPHRPSFARAGPKISACRDEATRPHFPNGFSRNQQPERTMTANTPTHIAYWPREYRAGKEMKSAWTEIGPAWAHKDGKGFNIELNLIPKDGKVIVRLASERDEFRRNKSGATAGKGTAPEHGYDDETAPPEGYVSEDGEVF
jgi:hypothetical protein